jgi:long-chain acyl-CoA synthetase
MGEAICYEDTPWKTHYEPGVPLQISYDDICLPEFLELSAKQFPNNPALIFEGYQLSYQQLHSLVNRLAGAIADLGIIKGDRVAILLPNIIPCVVAYYAVLKLGGIAVMNNPLYTDHELEYQFNDSGAKVLITLDLLANRMIALRPKTSIDHIIHTSLGDYLPALKRLFFPLVAKFKKLSAKVPPAPNVYTWKATLAETHSKPPEVSISQTDVAMYQYTGGTTGISKGVILTHGNLSKQTQQLAAWFPKLNKGKEIMLGALPFFHVFGLTTAMNLSVSLGWANVLVPKPYPDALIKAINTYKPTFAPLVPTMYIGILNHPDVHKADLKSITGCFSGSAPLPHDVISEFEAKTGAIIVEGYGLTESSPVTHVNPFAGGRRKVGSIGVPISDTLCRIVDIEDNTKVVPCGETGELLVKGPQVMQGYWNRPKETELSLTDGWLHTGDIGYMDEEGYFYIVDRKKDMILSGGYNVYPRDIEEVLFDHPSIQEAAAVGFPDAKLGEVAKVFVVLKQGESITEKELSAYCRERLAKYKVPAKIEFRKDLPKSNVGKILKKELREEHMPNQ